MPRTQKIRAKISAFFQKSFKKKFMSIDTKNVRNERHLKVSF